MQLASLEVELRNARRYPIRGAVSFSWVSKDGVLWEAQGITANLSGNGAFVVTDGHPEVGDEMDIEIYLKSASHEFKFVSLTGRGRVTRTITEGTRIGFGIQIDFRNQDPDDYFSNYVQ